MNIKAVVALQCAKNVISKQADLMMRSSEELLKQCEDSRKASSTIDTVSNNVGATITRDDISSIFRHESEVEKRRANLCIFGLPIVDSPNQTDKSVFIKLCSDQLGLPESVISADVLETRRVGSDHPGHGIGAAPRPKPLIVKLKSISIKSDILKNAHKLKNYNPPNSNYKVFVTNDLTKHQQSELTLLRSQLQRRRDVGEDVVIVRGQIVPRRNGNNSNPGSHGSPNGSMSQSSS